MAEHLNNTIALLQEIPLHRLQESHQLDSQKPGPFCESRGIATARVLLQASTDSESKLPQLSLLVKNGFILELKKHGPATSTPVHKLLKLL